jgi:flagellar protein FlgJ
VDTGAISSQLAIDAGALTKLKRQAKDDPRAGLSQAAQQFEAVFLQMVLKAMRDATPQDGVLDSDQGRLYQNMFDQQLAQTLAARGSTGLAAMIEKQLAKTLPPPLAAAGNGLPPTEQTSAPDTRFSLDTLRNAARQLIEGAPVAAGAAAGAAQVKSGPDAPREFVSRVWPHAQEASRATGIPGHFIVAQAALESGWGRGEIRLADGSTSFNLFNVKAGKGWTGETVDVTTTEYVNGTAQKQVERFRAYRSYAEAFADYANLLKSNPRYANVIGQQDGVGFARALQQAGYATDPMYAEKLARIIGSVSLRQGLSG